MSADNGTLSTWKSYRDYATVNKLLTTEQLRWFWRLYLDVRVRADEPSSYESKGSYVSYRAQALYDDNVDNYLVSPLKLPFWLMRLFPRTLVLTAKYDVLVDENAAFAQLLKDKLRDSGRRDKYKGSLVESKYACFNDSIHGFLGLPGSEASAAAIKLINEHLHDYNNAERTRQPSETSAGKIVDTSK
jgi:acetyl esterase/lipase